MKKIIVFICLLFVLIGTTAFAQELGGKVYKEVVVDGKKVNKWLTVFNITYYFYNDNRKTVCSKDLDGKDTWYEYDAKGNEIHYKTLYGSKAGHEIWYEYDDKGNLIHSKWSDGRETRYEDEYDDKGNLIHSKSSDGEEWWYDYDKKGKVIHVKDNKGVEKWYEYDKKGNLIQAKSVDGRKWKFAYDKNGNKIHVKFPDGTEWWYDYDKKGNLIHEKWTASYRSWNEQWFEYQYGENGEVKKKILIHQ